MAFLGLLAVLVVGVYFLTASTAGFARRLKAERLEFPSEERLVRAAVMASPAAEDVAVLITAHDREDRIVAALNSAARMVPLANIHVVSDDSTDRTADLARGYGVKTAETFGRLGPAGAIDTGIHTFRLLDEFKFVLLLDVDIRIDPNHLQRVLPRFDDPEVLAVDVPMDPDWRSRGRSALGRLLIAHRARAYALAQWMRRQPGGSPVFGALPSVVHTYRTSALAELERTPAGLATPDFDATLRLRRLGRLEFCAETSASPATPVRLGDYLRQTSRWHTAFWQAQRGISLAGADLVLTSLLFLLLPVAAGLAAARLLPVAVPITVLLADYLVTLAVAVTARQPRYLLPGLFLPLLRVVDGVTALRTLPHARRDPSPDWLAFGSPSPEPEPATAPATRSRVGKLGGLLTVFGWVVAIAAAVVVVIRVALTTATLPPTPVEPALVDATYGQGIGLGGTAVDPALLITNLQLRLYTTVTLAFDRHAGVLQAAREASIVAVATMVICLVAVAAIMRVRPLVIALVLGLIAVSGPAIMLLTPVGPNVFAAGWLALAILGTMASIGWHDGRGLTAAAIALLGALVTAPILVVPIGIGAAVWFASRPWQVPARIAAGGGALAVAGAGAIVLWRGGLLPAGSDLLGSGQRPVVLGVIAAAALGGLVASWLRPPAAAVGGGAVFVAVAGSRADVLLPSLLLAAAVLLAVMIEEALGWEPQRGRLLARRAAAGVAAAVALAGSVAAAGRQPPAWEPPEHAALAAWVHSNVDGEVKLAAPIGIWADLDRDLSRAGLPAGAVRRIPAGAPTGPEELVITAGDPEPAGVELARFGSLAIVSTNLNPQYLGWTSRARAGGQLADNPRLHTTDAVLAALRAGQVDLRAMALLAALCRDHTITVSEASKPAHEIGSPLPYRTITLSTVDGRSVAPAVIDWLHAQQPPFAPTDIRATPNGVTVSWRLPARLDQPPS
jgi:hypothetical protein